MSRERTLTAIGGLVTAGAVVAAALTITTVGGTLNAPPAAAAVAGTGVGYLHTDGAKIVDSRGQTVRLTGLNWFGNETDTGTFHGLWAGKPATWTEQLDHMAQLGYNTIRVPFTGSVIRNNAAVSGINTDTNPDLVGLNSMQIMDKVVNYAGSKGMRIFFDRHRPTTGGQTPLWNAGVSEASEISDWQFLAQRYAGNTTVIGADLFNEPHAEGTDPNGTGASWAGTDPARDWRLAAERIGNAILSANSNWLILVEGVSCDLPSGGTPNTWQTASPTSPTQCDWWGGNLSLAGANPVRLSVANRLVYSPHEYGISVYDRQPWFNDPAFPNNLPAIWDHFWGYLVKQNIAPVLVGEFGSTLANPLDVSWLKALMSYMDANGMSFTYWSWNPNSGDTGGIVGDDWYTVNQTKQAILAPSLNPPVANGSSPPVSPSASRSASRSPSASASASRSASASASRSASRSPSASTSPPPPGGCTATYTTVNSWPSGFQGSVTVKAGTASITGWKVTWTLSDGQGITQLWSGALDVSGTSVTVTNAPYNGSLAPNASTTFGFQGTGSASSPTLTCTGS
jgi:endoglucanase